MVLTQAKSNDIFQLMLIYDESCHEINRTVANKQEVEIYICGSVTLP